MGCVWSISWGFALYYRLFIVWSTRIFLSTPSWYILSHHSHTVFILSHLTSGETCCLFSTCLNMRPEWSHHKRSALSKVRPVLRAYAIQSQKPHSQVFWNTCIHIGSDDTHAIWQPHMRYELLSLCPLTRRRIKTRRKQLITTVSWTCENPTPHPRTAISLI